MKLLSVSILSPLLGLGLWLLGGRLDTCQAQERLTASGRPRLTATPSARLLRLPLAQKVDSVLHHLRAYPRASASQQRRYGRELAAYFAPSGYITVRQADASETRLSLVDYLRQFGRRRSTATLRFDGAEVVHYGESLETTAGNWQTVVTTYRPATNFSGNKPQAADIATVTIPMEKPPPARDYWQVFNLYLVSPRQAPQR
jgi:hypothetical protein